MAELKPCDCKKCNSKDVRIHGPFLSEYFGWVVECYDCGTATPLYLTKPQAIDAWNKRS